MKKIKVLMLVPNLFVANGVASFVMNYLRNLNHDEVQVDIASYKEGDSVYYAEVEAAGGKMFFLPGIKNLPEHVKVCNKILSEGQYDIVHDNTLHISIPMMWCAKQAGVRVRILHSHNSKMGETPAKAFRNRFFLPVLRSLATNYAACSQLAGRAMFEDQEFTVIPNVIQTEKYRFDPTMRKSVRQKMNATDKFVVGTVGRLAEQKNPFFAIDVFKCLLKIVSNAEYWWIGDGPLEEAVKDYINQKGLSENVRLLGSRNDVVNLYQGMDMFFLPSLFEGLPVTGVEAQAMGLPMVVSDTVTKEMVYTDLVVYVSLNETKERWADHLQKACKDLVERENYSNSLHESIFSCIDCGGRLERLYRAML
ncbi:MAG: glycosyltransferase family 1 protein [Faecalibacterium prausnitzii]|nr:glycosyltransferase family 1 protein [Faecalibacterium prausnitzii]